MKKTIIRIMAAVCAIVLSGCVRMRMSMDVSSSGDVKCGVTLLFREDLLSFNGADPDEQINAMISQYREQYPDAVVKKAEEKEGDTLYAGVSASGFENDALKAEVSEGMVTLRLPVSALTNELATTVMNGVNYSLNDLKEYGAQVTLEINMPAAASCNVGTVNGRRVFIDLLDLPAGTDDIVITSKAGLPLSTIMLIAGGVLLAGSCGYWLMKRKNGTGEEV